MKKKYYLYSDMDGTLINSQKEITEKNRQAIQTFIKQGGHFAVATGRSELITLPFIRDIPINAPCILFNGAAVYDFTTSAFLYKKIIPEKTVHDIIKTALAVYPSLCIEAFHGGPLTLVNPDGIMDHYITEENQPFVRGNLSEVNDCIKLLLYGEPEKLKAVRTALELQDTSEFSMTFSAPFYLEILPHGISKGQALEFILQQNQIDRDSVCAIGDFDNDIEMLKAAGLGAAPANAQETVRQAADIMVASNDEHAIYDLITNYLL